MIKFVYKKKSFLLQEIMQDASVQSQMI